MAKTESDGIRAKLHELVPETVNVLKDFHVVLSPEQRAGLTWGDLMEYQAIQSGCRGNSKSLSDTLDRAYGKVAQVNKNENLNMNMSYDDYLDKIEEDEVAFLDAGVVVTEVSETEVDPLAEFL